MKLGDRLREIRKEHLQTLVLVARSTELSVSYLSDIERGQATPSIDTLERIARHYNMDLATIVAHVDGWGVVTQDALPAGLVELIEENKISEDDAHDLSRIEFRGKRPQDAEEWFEIYLHLKRIMRPYLKEVSENKDEK